MVDSWSCLHILLQVYVQFLNGIRKPNHFKTDLVLINKKLDMTSFWIPTVCKMNTREKLLSPWILNKGNNWKHHSQFYLGWDSPWFKPCRLGFRPANPVTVGIWDLTIWNPEKLLKIGFQRVRVFKGYSYGPDYLKIGPFQIQTFLFGFQMVFRSLQ